jgi:hypothetical protein
MGEVVAFPGVTLEQRKREADDDIVALLERYLACARAGELEFIMVATVRDGVAGGAWEPTIYQGALNSAAMGAVQYMAHRFGRSLVDGATAEVSLAPDDPPA